MSDRRSFSEIPVEALREQGEAARIARIWQRLEPNLAHSGSRKRARVGGAFVAVAAVAFAFGVLVGAGSFQRGGAGTPVAALGAEPAAARALPAAAAPAEPQVQAAASRAAPRVRALHHGVAPRRAESELVAQSPEPVVAAPLEPADDWKRLADEGQYDDALASLDARGGFDAALREASADQLMSLVDVARATGQRERAIVVLRQIVSEHGSDPNAPVAAWMLGNELSKVHDLASAEQAFALYRALSPGGDFAEDALARQIDMAVEQGNLEHAKKLAGQYLKEFPEGPRSAEFQSQVEESVRQPAAPGEGEHPASQALPDAGVSR